MTSEAERRSELSGFLRARRAAISPADVGLPASGRRRTPGLRREEVAELAGVGLSWYTWLEQGRDISPSLQVLESLARALRMTPGEREHLMKLAGASAASQPMTSVLDEQTRRMIAELTPHPAYVLDDRFDVVAHNLAAELVMQGLMTAPQSRRNLLLWLFSGRRDWDGMQDSWSQTARANLLDFRTAYADHAGEQAFASLLSQLEETGQPFHDWWTAHDVAPLEPTDKIFRHPTLGDLRMHQLQSHLGHAPHLRLRILVPADDRTRRILATSFSARTAGLPTD